MAPDRVALFWSRTARDGTCLVWTAGRTKRGYGAFRVGGRDIAAHRVSYELSVGPVPAGMVVRHTCDRSLCVEPTHLIVGTQRDNMQDKFLRSRDRVRGEENSNARLSTRDVIRIRELRASGVRVARLAEQFSIKSTDVCKIASGRTWGSVGGPITPTNPRADRSLQSIKAVEAMVARTAGLASKSSQAARWVEDGNGTVTAAAERFGVSRQAVSCARSRLMRNWPEDEVTL